MTDKNKTGLNIPPPLSAQDRSSFAYKTIKDRLPVIVVKTIDFFHRQRKELHKFGGTIESPNDNEILEIEADSKQVISELTKIRKDVETNKPTILFEPIGSLTEELNYFNDDIELWNKTLEANRLSDQSMPKYFESAWLLVECYLYRKLKEVMLKTKHLKLFDPFVEQKQMATKTSLSQMGLVGAHLCQVDKVYQDSNNFSHPSERSEFTLFMQLALWANKSDLSISGMSADKIQANKLAIDLRESLESFQANILCDNLSYAWYKILSIKNMVSDKLKHVNTSLDDDLIYIDLVADNAGYEIFVDFCLLHFLSLLLCGGREAVGVKFRIHIKRMPWFVSDAIKQDVDWLINYLMTQDQEPSLKTLGKRWKNFIDSKFWIIQEHKFWTLSNDYSEMSSVSPDLYSTLQTSKLIIFKGDLNYRKLTGDRKWHLLTPFRNALRGFEPAPLVALRTAKADVVVGIDDINIFARINNNELPPDWMISGDYGLIQYADPI